MSETEPITVPYVALTGQPAGTPWPTDGWPTGDAPSGVPLGPLLDELFDDVILSFAACSATSLAQLTVLPVRSGQGLAGVTP